MVHAEEYNALPSVEEAHKAMSDLGFVRERLCEIIERFGLSNAFGVRLIHKHFPMEEGEMPTFRPVEIPGICTAILMGPLRANPMQLPLYGKHFLVKGNEDALIPFEFTTMPCEDPSHYPEFNAEFRKVLLSFEAEKVLGLCADPKALGVNYTEFELTEKRSTVMVPEQIFPSVPEDVALITNWVANKSIKTPAAMPEPMDNCIITRSSAHYGSCRSTRNGHYTTSKGAVYEDSLFLRAIEEVGSPLHQVMQVVMVAA